MRCSEEEDDEDNEQEEVECDLLEHGLDPVDWLCLTSRLTNNRRRTSEFRGLQCGRQIHQTLDLEKVASLDGGDQTLE